MTLLSFETALGLMKEGKSVARRGWERKPSLHRKVKVALSPQGGIRTWYLNYYSDNGVIGVDDILANDWIEVGG